MEKAKYEIIQPPHMTDEEFESLANDIDSIIGDNLCIDCDDNTDCKKGMTCKYYTFDKGD